MPSRGEKKRWAHVQMHRHQLVTFPRTYTRIPVICVFIEMQRNKCTLGPISRMKWNTCHTLQ